MREIAVIRHYPEIEKIEAKNPEKIPVFLELFDETRQELILSQTDFMEVNLAEMKVKLYKKGLLENEFAILKRGDPQGWGGSAVGLYKVLDGSKLSFSGIANVYMPYAIHYYGKYYIHGEPYYSFGGTLDSPVSGGCINLSTEDAQSVFELAELNMPVLVVDKDRDYYDYSKEEPSEFPEISAQSYLAADLDSGQIFAEKNSQEQFPIASLTKLMTAIIVSENVDLRKSILIDEEMLKGYGSTKGLEKGKWFRVVELFYPLLIESSNDAAEALSYFLGRTKTIRLMNEKTKDILMDNTKFVDPSGFDPENVSTARDLFYLARYILNNRPLILDITKGNEVLSFGEINFNIKDFWNKNIFINDPTFVGGKTGFIKASKNTAVFIFHFSADDGVERNVVIIILEAENTESDAQKIYKWLQENYFKNSVYY
jgi:D-alanyl-D-alanine carboxypeptidase